MGVGPLSSASDSEEVPLVVVFSRFFRSVVVSLIRTFGRPVVCVRGVWAWASLLGCEGRGLRTPSFG